MGEIAQLIHSMERGRMSTAIIKYQSGRYGLVGSVPEELTKPVVRTLTPGLRASIVWNTEAEAVAALLAIGTTKFQMADCSWYQAHATKGGE